MSLPAEAQVCDWPAFERETYFQVLLHDDRSSYYVVSTDESGVWRDIPVKRDQLGALSFDGRSNYYVTHNGFTGKRRLVNRTRQLNALFFDLDCHGSSPDACDTAVEAALRAIVDAVQTGALPNPSLIVNSGRGLHVYYVLEKSVPYRTSGKGEVNEKGVSFFKDVQARLADVLEEVVEGIPDIRVDRAVFDFTRVARIPGTFNAKAGRAAKLVSANESYHHLSDLATYRPSKLHCQQTPPKKAVILRFHPLMMSRLNKLYELQEHRGFSCVGRRELMCFVFYNTAVQIYSRQDAKERLVAYNDRFTAPLDGSELAGILRAVDTVKNVRGERGHYILGGDTLVRLLGLTEQEMLDLQFFASKRTAERMEAKRKTKEKKETRNKRIIKLHQAGDKTQEEIADAAGCCVRTVYAVLKEAGLTGHHTKPQERQETSQKDAAAPRKEEAVETAVALLSGLKSAKNWQTCLRGVQKRHVGASLLVKNEESSSDALVDTSLRHRICRCLKRKATGIWMKIDPGNLVTTRWLQGLFPYASPLLGFG